MKVLQGAMTPQQGQEHLTMIQGSQSHAFPEQGVLRQFPTNNQISSLQHVIRAQDPSYARQFSAPIAQGQNISPPRVAFPQEQVASWQNYQEERGPVNQGKAEHRLRMLHAQATHFVREGEKDLQACNSSGVGCDIRHQQQIRASLDVHKQRLLELQEIIDAKTRGM